MNEKIEQESTLETETSKKTKAETHRLALETTSEPRKEDALTVLRTETALSRFPLHRLTKGKAVQIELENEASAVLWRVDHNSRYGQPGALAYKLDSLFINRRIEEAGRPTPKTIRLGSLREIAEEIGSGNNTGSVKQALLQNATASITAKISYRTQNEGEQWLEAVFSRYSVVFTGEKFPQGGTADAVYLVLNDIYQQILNTAVYRPLDYDYMKALPPIAQRFYEIVSYQIYAAVHRGNPRAKLLYSEYCLLSTATRYFDFDHVKKQMYKVLRPHTQSGYIAKVEYEAHTNEQGQADWWMYFTPGPNAGREYQAFTGSGKMRRPGQANRKKDRGNNIVPPALPFPEQQENQNTSKPENGAVSSETDSHTELIERLVAAELNRGDAERLAREKPAECERQLLFLSYVQKFTTSRGAYLRRAIEEGYGPPKAYAQVQTREESAQAARRKRGEEALRLAEETARQSHERRFSEAFAAFLGEWVGEWEKTHAEAFVAFKRYEAEKRQALINGPLAHRELGKKAIEAFDVPAVRADRIEDFCRQEGRKFGLQPLTFWEWDAAHNTEPFRF